MILAGLDKSLNIYDEHIQEKVTGSREFLNAASFTAGEDIEYSNLMSNNIKRPICKDVFEHDGKQVESSAPVKISISKEEGGYLAENTKLHIFATGETEEEALEDFESQLIYFYGEYTNCRDEKLNAEARLIREIYQTRFKEKVS